MVTLHGRLVPERGFGIGVENRWEYPPLSCDAVRRRGYQSVASRIPRLGVSGLQLTDQTVRTMVDQLITEAEVGWRDELA
jgi:hypothetical protein